MKTGQTHRIGEEAGISQNTEIRKLLKEWYSVRKRNLPWRNTNDAYDTLLSEFILQQTRIEQGTPYFLRIKKAFPSIVSLAGASEEKVLHYWQGLGYYSRARNLHATARIITEKYGGVIPSDFDELKRLKGIGEYTAAAIASIAYGKPHPLMDGNVLRVISRLFAVDTPVNTTEGKKHIRNLLNGIFDKDDPGHFNEAMMDFGALQCMPANPDCPSCPFGSICVSRTEGRVPEFPVKTPPKPVKIRYLNYLAVRTSDCSAILKKRTGKDIWQGLYEFPLAETEEKVAEEMLNQTDFWTKFFPGLKIEQLGGSIRKTRKLTHQLLHISFTLAETSVQAENIHPPYIVVSPEKIAEKPFPVVISGFLNTMNKKIKP